MNRRDALKSLTALAGAAGITVTPITAHAATDVTLVILRTDRILCADECRHLEQVWTAVCQGTALQHVKTIVLSDGIEVEIVRSRL